MRPLLATLLCSAVAVAIAGCGTSGTTATSPPSSLAVASTDDPQPPGAFLVRDQATQALAAYAWDGTAAPMPAVVGGVASHEMALRPAASPDGRWFVVTRSAGGALQRSITAADGRVVTALDLADQYVWGDDSRHVCVLSNPMRTKAGAPALRVVDVETGRVQSLGGLSWNGATAGIPTIVACAAQRGDAVLRIDSSTMNGTQLQTSTVSLAVVAMTTGQVVDVVGRNALGDGVHATVAPDGSWYATAPASGSGPSQVRALPSGALLRTVRDGAVLTSSSNGRLLIVSRPGASPSDETIEVVRLAGGAVVWSVRGHLLSIARAPFSSEMAVGIGVVTPGPGAEPAQDLYLVGVAGGRLLLHHAAAD